MATTEDILQDEDVIRGQLERTAEQNNVFREAFRPVDLSDAGSDTVTFVIDTDTNGIMEIVEEGAEFNRELENARRVKCVRKKVGEEYALTKEAQMDGYYDNKQIEAENKMDKMRRTLDYYALTAMQDNTNPDLGEFASDDADATDGQLDYYDLVDGRAELQSAPYQANPDAVFAGPKGVASLMKQDEFIHATEAGDDVIRNGRIGRMVGIGDIYVSDSGAFDNNEAIMVDTQAYGREGQWELPNTNSYPEPQTQTDLVMQMWAFMGWCVTQPNNALKIAG